MNLQFCFMCVYIDLEERSKSSITYFNLQSSFQYVNTEGISQEISLGMVGKDRTFWMTYEIECILNGAL